MADGIATARLPQAPFARSVRFRESLCPGRRMKKPDALRRRVFFFMRG